MNTKLNMIRTANVRVLTAQQQSTLIVANLTDISEATDISLRAVTESVFSLLANIAMNVENGNPLKLLHLNSIAAFLAGVETIAHALPDSTDVARKQTTLRQLMNAGISDDGMVNDATFPIINLGARAPTLHKHWADLINKYATEQSGGKVDGSSLVREIRSMQQLIDRAMRNVSQPRTSTMP